MGRTKLLLLSFLLLSFVGTASAATLIEDFENPFSAWETRWLKLNSNLVNFYIDTNSRGNNPDGLWQADGDGLKVGNDFNSEIQFNTAFGSTLSYLKLDVAGYSPIVLQIFDKDGNILLNQDVTLTEGAYTDPGVYVTYSANSANGIGGWRFLSTSGQIEGWTSIDNVEVTTGAEPIPEPVTMLLLGSGLLGLA